MSDTVTGEVHRYRVLAEIPRAARPGLTTWRTIAVGGSYSEVGDFAGNLLDSMELAGIDRELARHWLETRVRCVPETVTTTRGEPENMPIGP